MIFQTLYGMKEVGGTTIRSEKSKNLSTDQIHELKIARLVFNEDKNIYINRGNHVCSVCVYFKDFKK